MPPPATAPRPAPIKQALSRSGDIDEQPAAKPAIVTQRK
jgi:hypothetical protein